MSRDPQVDLIFSHFTPRYIATGVDPNDLERLKTRIGRWDDWCRIWSEEAALHERLGTEASHAGRRVTASESFLRAAIYYHYAKHLFADRVDEYRAAHEAMLRCYAAAAPDMDPPAQHLTFPFEGAQLHGWLRCPKAPSPLPVAIILPGLDACKEELHAWSEAFLARGLATLTLDGPGQGESAFALPVRTDWGKVIGAVIDGLNGPQRCRRRCGRRRRPESRRVLCAARRLAGVAHQGLHRQLRPLRLGARFAADAESVAGGLPRPQPRRHHRTGA